MYGLHNYHNYVAVEYCVLIDGHVLDTRPMELLKVKEQQQVSQCETRKQDPRDETVRGTLPIFKLRSKEDREGWKKLVSDKYFMF